MNKITQFGHEASNKAAYDALSHDIREALAAVAAKHGVQVTYSGKSICSADQKSLAYCKISFHVDQAGDSPYLEGVSPAFIAELTKHHDTHTKLLHVMEYGGKKCVIIGRKSAKILFKPLGEPGSSIKVWNAKMDGRDAQAELLRAAVAAAQPL